MKKNYIEQQLHLSFGESSLKKSAIYNCIVETKFNPEALKKRDKPGRKADSQLLNRIHVIADIINEIQSSI
jgi:hypothetical protein